MFWLVWRQHRVEALTAVVLLALVSVPVILTGTAMHAEYDASGLAACAGSCSQLEDQFNGRYSEWANRLLWAAFLPALVGVFVGAPLLAREFEQGTWRLAFTQSVSRTRWLVTKLALVGAGAVVAAIAFGSLLSWWRGPIDALNGRLKSSAFIVAWPSLGAATLFAFALGVFAGALLRRTIAAMGATLAVYAAVRIPVEEGVRPHYLTPLIRITDPLTPGGLGRGDWVVDEGWVDAAGQRLSEKEEWAIVRQVYGADQGDAGVARYMAEHGLRRFTEYHPAASFVSFQLIEVAVFAGLAAVLLSGAVLLIRRRIG